MLAVSGKTPLRSTNRIPSVARRRHFQIKLRGRVDEGWMAAFDPLSFSSSEQMTVFEVLADQAALRGILNRLWDLNLDVFSVNEMVRPAVQNGGLNDAEGCLPV